MFKLLFSSSVVFCEMRGWRLVASSRCSTRGWVWCREAYSKMLHAPCAAPRRCAAAARGSRLGFAENEVGIMMRPCIELHSVIHLGWA